jgi:hypothetical protein
MKPESAVRLALGLALLCGCSQKSSESSVTTTQPDTAGAAGRAQTEAQIHEHLAATRAHIDSLRAETARVGSNVDAAVSSRLAQVEAQRDTAESRLARLQQATQEEWRNLEAGVATMLDSLDVGVDSLRAQLHRRSH